MESLNMSKLNLSNVQNETSNEPTKNDEIFEVKYESSVSSRIITIVYPLIIISVCYFESMSSCFFYALSYYFNCLLKLTIY